MTNALPATAPGFDQPIAMLKHCHDRIRQRLATLQTLPEHLAQHGADDAARQGAQAVLAFFDKAAHWHHADEEDNLMPMLLATAQGEDAATLARLVPGILQDHAQMDAMWHELHAPLSAVADGSAAELSATAVQQFTERYADHMALEETQITPMAKRLFSAAQMAQLGTAMQVRRGISPAPTNTNTDTGAGAGTTVADLRKDYSQATLNEADITSDPFDQFTTWFEQALAADINEPNAMSLASVDADGRPTSRIVLIKQFDRRGFTWFTNYASQKGRQLAANPHAALLFFWSELERQVRIEGVVERISNEESDAYFHSRPLKSRLSAIASIQSEPIASRAALEAHYDEVALQYGETPPRPEHWGGLRLVPQRIEFWQGRRSRFHDRIVYTLQPDGSWTRQRLQP